MRRTAHLNRTTTAGTRLAVLLLTGHAEDCPRCRLGMSCVMGDALHETAAEKVTELMRQQKRKAPR